MGKTRSVVEGLRGPKPSEGDRTEGLMGGVERLARSAALQAFLLWADEAACNSTAWSGEGGSTWGECLGD
jgi:hypothetical protein